MHLDSNSIILTLPIPYRAWSRAFHWCLEKFGAVQERWMALSVKTGDPFVFVFKEPQDAVTFMLNWNEWYRK